MKKSVKKIVIFCFSLKTPLRIHGFLLRLVAYGCYAPKAMSPLHFLHLHACVLSQPCPAPCDPMDCSPPGSSVHGILQPRTLE